MRIEVADAFSKTTLTYVADASDQSILYLRLAPSVEPIFLEQLIYSLPDASRRLADYVVVRALKREAESLIDYERTEGILQTLLHRTEKRPILLLRWDGRNHEFSEFSLDNFPPPAPDALRALRAADLHHLMHRKGVLLPSLQDFHYEGPNGDHYRAFLRPGLAMFSPEVLESLSFWLVPFLRNAPTILVDSGSMIPLALHAVQYASQSGYVPAADPPWIDSLRSYAEDDLTVARRVKAAMATRPGRPILILNSVRSSGRLLTRLMKACAAEGADVKVVSLFAMTTAGFPEEEVFYKLGDDFQPTPTRDCLDCRERKAVVRIDPTTYLLELSAVAKRTAIAIGHAQRAKRFFKAYKGLDVVAVHHTRRDPNEKPRHHAIHIDVAKIIDHPEFNERFSTEIDKLRDRFDIVLSPTHPTAIQLAARAADTAGVPVLHCDEDQLPSLDPEKLAQLRQAKGILLIDDVVLSGTRLRGYKYYLRKIDALATEQTLNALVALARTASDESFARISEMLAPRGAVAAVERLHLPNWNETDCPWCAEQIFLQKHLPSESLPESMKARLAALNDTATGLRDKIFLHWRDLDEEMTLGHGSIFGEGLNQAELFSAVAASIQELRQSQELDEEFQPPIARVISPDSYLTGRYYENLIEAAIVRASRRHDVRTATIENELVAKIGRRLTESFSAELIGELLLAIAVGKLPPAPEIDEALLTGEPGIVTMFRVVFSSRKVTVGALDEKKQSN